MENKAIELPDFVTAVKALYEKDIKQSPCYSNRASQLGYSVPELNGCVRRGVYTRTSWQDADPWSVDSIIRFNEGNLQERNVLVDLMKAGFDCIEQQSHYEWKDYQITGHVDFKIILGGVAIPVEIKSMSPNIFCQVHCFDDLKKKAWLRSYMCQITVYMLMQNVDKGIFLLKDKSSGLMKQINVELDYDLGEACIRTAEEINKHVKNETLPERINDREVCSMCSYKTLCLPDIQWGEPLKIIDDPMFEDRVKSCLDIKETASAAKKMWDTIRAEAKAQAGESGELNMVIGAYHITGKTDTRGAFKTKIEIL